MDVSRKIKLEYVKLGMQISDDVYNRDAQLIVPKGVSVSQKVLDRLKFHSIERVPVFFPEGEVPPGEEGEPKSGEPTQQDSAFKKTHSQKLRESKAFYEYSESFYEAKDAFEYELNDIVERDGKVDVDKMFNTTADIIKNADNSFHVFDMLHNMRNFDDQTYAHSLNVSIICNIMGQWLKMSEEDIRILTVAGLMHDIGKLLIPQEILAKPGRLTEEEFATIQSHPMQGYQLISKQNLDRRIGEAALCHHEKLDGTGYPMHFKGDQIPPFARIVCIVDIYEAMTADRVYRKGICPFDVIAQFEAEGFQKYDVRYLLTFLKGIAQTYQHETVQLSNGEQGEIVMLNEQVLSKPMIHTKEGKFIDLSKEPGLFIQQIM